MSRVITATVTQVKPLTSSILQVILKPTKYVDYQPGQYLQILFQDNRPLEDLTQTSQAEAISYSIANAPLGARHYELHIRHSRDNIITQQLLDVIKQIGRIIIRLPLGDCHLQRLSPNKPILFVAGGTGFAPIKAMIEQLLASGDKRVFELFWGARVTSDLYMDEQVRQWQAHVEQFRYFSLSSAHTKKTLATKILAHHQHDLMAWQIVIAGPLEMAYAIRDSLLKVGLGAEQLFSDAFTG